MRAAGSPSLPLAGRGTDGGLQLHRGRLKSAAPELGWRSPIVYEQETGSEPTSETLLSQVPEASTKTGQSQSAPAGYASGYAPAGYGTDVGSTGTDATTTDGSVSYCIQRFRFCDRRSGTYLGNDRRRHSCPCSRPHVPEQGGLRAEMLRGLLCFRHGEACPDRRPIWSRRAVITGGRSDMAGGVGPADRWGVTYWSRALYRRTMHKCRPVSPSDAGSDRRTLPPSDRRHAAPGGAWLGRSQWANKSWDEHRCVTDHRGPAGRPAGALR